MLFSVFAAYFLAFALPKSGAPLKVFEWEYFSAAVSAAASGVPASYGAAMPSVEHPPFYPHLLGSVMEFTGPSVRAARVMGVILALSACLPLLLLSNAVSAGVAFLPAAAFFLTSPAIIQGSAIIGAADTGLLLPLLPLLCWALLMFQRRPAFSAGALAAGLFAVCLWAKFTTSLAVPAFFLGWRAVNRDRAGFLRELAIFSAGAGLFVASWALYCRLVVGMEYFHVPLSYSLTQFSAGMPAGGILERLARSAADFTRILAWLSPFLLAAAAAAFPGWKNDDDSSGRGLLLFATFVLLGYAVVRGTGGGFPKYELPAVGFFCLAAGARFARELSDLGVRERLGLGLMTAVAFAYAFFALGDTVLYAQELARYASLRGAGAALRAGALPSLAYFLPFCTAVPLAARLSGWSAGRAFFLTALCFAFGYNFALNARQLSAGYSTTYAYGTSGSAEAAEFLRANTAPDSPVIGAFETLYSAGNRRALFMPGTAWNSSEGFISYAAALRPAAVVCGLGTNTAVQQAEVFDSPAARAYLSSSYDEHIFGSYTVWLKRNGKK